MQRVGRALQHLSYRNVPIPPTSTCGIVERMMRSSTDVLIDAKPVNVQTHAMLHYPAPGIRRERCNNIQACTSQAVLWTSQRLSLVFTCLHRTAELRFKCSGPLFRFDVLSPPNRRHRPMDYHTRRPPPAPCTRKPREGRMGTRDQTLHTDNNRGFGLFLRYRPI